MAGASVSVTLVATVELLPVSESVGPGDKESLGPGDKGSLLRVPEALGEGDEGGFRLS